ncbi:hypothetical protein MASR2M48_04310 [Spirochaetota bacterium]
MPPACPRHSRGPGSYQSPQLQPKARQPREPFSRQLTYVLHALAHPRLETQGRHEEANLGQQLKEEKAL